MSGFWNFIVFILVLLILVIFTVLFLRRLSLKRPIKTYSGKLLQDKFAVIAHRGGALEAPENTLHAFRNAYEFNSRVLFEFDLRQTKDSEIVILHDPSVDRTTNGTGLIKDMTLEDVKKLDAGFRFALPDGNRPFANQGVQIPLFRDVLREFPNTQFIVEIKSDDPGIEHNVLKLIMDANATERVVVSSFNDQIMKRLKAISPELNYGASYEDVSHLLLFLFLRIEPLANLDCRFFFIPERFKGHTILNKKLIDEIHRRNQKVYIWTVNEEADMRRLRAMGVDGLVTDRPSLLYKLINSQ